MLAQMLRTPLPSHRHCHLGVMYEAGRSARAKRTERSSLFKASGVWDRMTMKRTMLRRNRPGDRLLMPHPHPVPVRRNSEPRQIAEEGQRTQAHRHQSTHQPCKLHSNTWVSEPIALCGQICRMMMRMMRRPLRSQQQPPNPSPHPASAPSAVPQLPFRPHLPVPIAPTWRKEAQR